jgi:hypothetical protein
MKKKITNTHKEPIVLPLMRPKGLCKFPQRAHENLLVGESKIVDVDEISPEIEKIRKRGKVKIEDLAEPKLKAAPILEPKVATEKKFDTPPPIEEEKSLEELELELELEEQTSKMGTKPSN